MHILFFATAILFSACAQAPHKNKTHREPTHVYYLEFIGWEKNPDLYLKVKKRLSSRPCFTLKDISEGSGEENCHAFVEFASANQIQNPGTGARDASLLKVKLVNMEAGKVTFNIQAYKRDGVSLRRYYNPGDFTRPTKHQTPTSAPLDELIESVVVGVTFK